MLRSKAAERNPDEFYHGMLGSHSKGGRKIADKGNTSLRHEAVKLLKTQDSGYLRTMIQENNRQIERREEIYSLGEKEKGLEATDQVIVQDYGQKVVYVEDLQSQRDISNNSSTAHFKGSNLELEEPQDLLQPHQSRRRLEKDIRRRKEEVQRRIMSKKEQRSQHMKLIALRRRGKELRDAEIELEAQRAKIRNVVGGVNKAGTKFKIRERKT